MRSKGGGGAAGGNAAPGGVAAGGVAPATGAEAAHAVLGGVAEAIAAIGGAPMAVSGAASGAPNFGTTNLSSVTVTPPEGESTVSSVPRLPSRLSSRAASGAWTRSEASTCFAREGGGRRHQDGSRLSSAPDAWPLEWTSDWTSEWHSSRPCDKTRLHGDGDGAASGALGAGAARRHRDGHR